MLPPRLKTPAPFPPASLSFHTPASAPPSSWHRWWGSVQPLLSFQELEEGGIHLGPRFFHPSVSFTLPPHRASPGQRLKICIVTAPSPPFTCSIAPSSSSPPTSLVASSSSASWWAGRPFRASGRLLVSRRYPSHAEQLHLYLISATSTSFGRRGLAIPGFCRGESFLW